MNIGIKFLPDQANRWDVDRAVSKILHSDAEERKINYQVRLNPSKLGGLRNDGTGLLTIPNAQVARRFLACLEDNPIAINKKKIKFYRKEKEPTERLAFNLDRTPYVSPDVEEEHEEKLRLLEYRFRVEILQIGRFYRAQYPTRPGEKLSPRVFSIEWESGYVGWMEFDYDSKLISVKLADPVTDYVGSSLAIAFTNIHKVGVGYHITPYLCFDLFVPPAFETYKIHDEDKSRQRIAALDGKHAAIAEYAYHVRIVLHNDTLLNMDIIAKFVEMCRIAGIPDNSIIRCPLNAPIEASKTELYNPKLLHKFSREIKPFPWSVGFQLEALIHNGLLHTREVMELIPSVRKLCDQYRGKDDNYVGDMLCRFNEALQMRPMEEGILALFNRIRDTFEPTRLSKHVRTYHATFTPTRMLLEGPYPTQSNRVIRQYRAYHDFFIRVNFADEDRLRFRSKRNVDGSAFVRDRVGTLLKDGFELAGRRFEFLAYSNSALKEHSVWFMSPFKRTMDDGLGESKHKEIEIKSDFIRDNIGDFKGTDLLKCPSKYAARIAQAFTATDASVTVRRDQWIEIDDLKSEVDGSLFTDGVGTISESLADDIWKARCAERRDNGNNAVKPSAYQIRFLGYKGVVAVDKELGKCGSGIQMCLRNSMRKFDVLREAREADAPIEIAQSFDRPNPFYLNRPLIMLLEDLGVRREAFMDLQGSDIENAETIGDSLSHFIKVLDGHNLGAPFGLVHLLKNLQDLQLELVTKKNVQGIDTLFFKWIRETAVWDILREIKYFARILVPDSFLLVGVADEGPSYQKRGYENVYCLPEGHIFACIQNPGDKEPKWVEGRCSISRSPVAHPGDVQRVRAIGKPPVGMLCLFAHLKNVVVMPSIGGRSLSSCLGGGDLDGDMFAVIHHSTLLPNIKETPASYEVQLPRRNPNDRNSNVKDICDFVVEFINSDVLGLLSTRLLIIADQSKEGMRDPSCIELAGLCSQAVDYPKHGIRVDLDEIQLPSTLIRRNPDWLSKEINSSNRIDFYDSVRALGYLYRNIELGGEPKSLCIDKEPPSLLANPISRALESRLRRFLGEQQLVGLPESEDIKAKFRKYVAELRYICATHTVSNIPGVRLVEAEIVIGRILTKTTQKGHRTERQFRMREHTSTLVREVQVDFIDVKKASEVRLVNGLRQGWEAWIFSLGHNDEFGANSFGLIALNVIFNCLEYLRKIKPTC